MNDVHTVIYKTEGCPCSETECREGLNLKCWFSIGLELICISEKHMSRECKVQYSVTEMKTNVAQNREDSLGNKTYKSHFTAFHLAHFFMFLNVCLHLVTLFFLPDGLRAVWSSRVRERVCLSPKLTTLFSPSLFLA